MKTIGFAGAILGLAVSAHASIVSLSPAAQPQQYFAVTITASLTVPITNAYFLYGSNYLDDNNLYSQEAYGAVPIGTLAAATSASPDVITVDIPQIWITDPAYKSPIPVVPDRAGWSVEGRYAPGGVSVSGSGLISEDGGWRNPQNQMKCNAAWIVPECTNNSSRSAI